MHSRRYLRGILMLSFRTPCRKQSTSVRTFRQLQQIRENAGHCQEVLGDPDTKFAFFYEGKPLLIKQGNNLTVPLKSLKDLQQFKSSDDILKTSVLLCSHGNSNNSAIFGVEISPKMELRENVEEVFGGRFVNPMKAIVLLPGSDLTMVSQGLSYLRWHANNQFCSKCGSGTEKTPAGTMRHCSKCKTVHYPTTSPVVLTLVHNGDQCLLARQPKFPENFYSALAGYCDTGETFEKAVHREVAEEVGLEVEDISYHSSQHWPFPSSTLMLGCHARLKPGTSHTICVDKNELDDAQWFDREEVKEALNFQSLVSSQKKKDKKPRFQIPPPVALAHQLIKSWALG